MVRSGTRPADDTIPKTDPEISAKRKAMWAARISSPKKSSSPVDKASMERRSEPRFGTDNPVHVSLLGDDEVTLEGRMVNVSGRGIRLILDRPLPLNAAVRVDCNDSILLGEVCYVKQQDEVYAVGLSLDQAVHDLAQLAQLTEAVLNEMHEIDRRTCYPLR